MFRGVWCNIWMIKMQYTPLRGRTLTTLVMCLFTRDMDNEEDLEVCRLILRRVDIQCRNMIYALHSLTIRRASSMVYYYIGFTRHSFSRRFNQHINRKFDIKKLMNPLKSCSLNGTRHWYPAMIILCSEAWDNLHLIQAETRLKEYICRAPRVGFLNVENACHKILALVSDNDHLN